MGDTFYLMTFSYDWEDGYESVNTLEDLVASLREHFEIDPALEPFSTAFNDAITEAYENGKWKSFQILEVNCATKMVRSALSHELAERWKERGV